MVSIMLAICVAFFSNCALSTSSPTTFNSTQVALIENFARYYLTYGTSDAFLSDGTCDLKENRTQSMLMENIQRCVRLSYTPRILSANQISWKKTSRHQKNTNSSMSSNHSSTNLANMTTADNQQADNSSDVIYDYMAFAMLLPTHPFSQELYSTLVTVAPLFPNVNVVIGSGYEFKEMCAQYGVRSFPKLREHAASSSPSH